MGFSASCSFPDKKGAVHESDDIWDSMEQPTRPAISLSLCVCVVGVSSGKGGGVLACCRRRRRMGRCVVLPELITAVSVVRRRLSRVEVQGRDRGVRQFRESRGRSRDGV
ncbi:hypothetical protein L1887_11707 [Cichorium endivia]|nr:hypothetical protein L1887_11707 [Cichorium endivia]